VAQKFHFAILRIEVTRASRGLSAIAELFVTIVLISIALYSCGVIIRPHHSSIYVDAACCYKPSSVVCLSVCDSSIWALQKMAEQNGRSICRLCWEVGWAKGFKNIIFISM